MNKSYYKAIHQIIKTGHWITDQVSKELKEFNISEPQYNVLRILEEAKGEPVTVEGILKKMIQRSSNITRIVDKLQAKEYVERKECTTNRRKMDISITDKGLVFLKKLDKKVQEFHKPLQHNLTKKELELLEELILKLGKGA